MAVDFKLYLITDRKKTELPLSEAVRQALRGGVRAIQLREKDLPVRELLALAQEIRTITGAFGAKLFINDRVDVAVAVDADGVHLGNQSMPPEAVRKVVGKRVLIAVSTHNLDEAIAAQRGGADFITYGPIYHTEAKVKYGMPVGSESIKIMKNSINIPIFALGGIKSGNIQNVLDSGAYGIAMISAIFSADDIEAASREMAAIAGQAS
ncbi:MAG: thiamine phosphate synthase [Betaproteobacteria bacterium]